MLRGSSQRPHFERLDVRCQILTGRLTAIYHKQVRVIAGDMDDLSTMRMDPARKKSMPQRAHERENEHLLKSTLVCRSGSGLRVGGNHWRQVNIFTPEEAVLRYSLNL